MNPRPIRAAFLPLRLADRKVQICCLCFVSAEIFVGFGEWLFLHIAAILGLANGQKGGADMPDTKNLCAHIPVDLYAKVSTSKTVANQTISEYVTNLLTEYYDWKENGGANMARENGKERTLAFQISEDLFQRIKAHLERESRRLGSKVTQKDFVIGLIEAALAEAEQAKAERAAAERAGSVEAAQGEDTERQDETERRDEADMNSAPEENAQEAPCEDGVATDEGVASQPTENG